MTTVAIRPGDLIALDPSDRRVIQFDWDDENLAATTTIISSAFALTAIRQAGGALTLDSASILLGNRNTQIRLDATTATNGDEYLVANTIVTSESPAQTKEYSIRVLVQNQ